MSALSPSLEQATIEIAGTIANKSLSEVFNMIAPFCLGPCQEAGVAGLAATNCQVPWVPADLRSHFARRFLQK